MALRVARSKAPTDLALALLSTALTGHDFTISRSSPARGKLLIAHLEYSVDLPRLTSGDPTQLCFGVAAGYASTICPAHRHRDVLTRARPPKVCGKHAEVPPFTYCVGADQAPVTAPLSPSVETPVAFTGCWMTKTASFDQSEANTTVSDVDPRVYFVYRFTRLAAGMYISVSLRGPDGSTFSIGTAPLRITNPGSTYYKIGPYSIRDYESVPDGEWTVTLALAKGPGAGAHCSSSFTVVAGG